MSEHFSRAKISYATREMREWKSGFTASIEQSVKWSQHSSKRKLVITSGENVRKSRIFIEFLQISLEK